MTSTITFESRVEAAQAGTHALIDLDALAGNAAALRRRLPADAELMAVVKANAYGHGDVPCARVALAAGATRLAVARIEEGLLLRRAGIAAPILVISPPNPRLARAAVEADLSLAVGTFDALDAVTRAVDGAGLPARVHVKVETGLYRYGVEAARAVDFARIVAADARVRFEGIYTHFATADEADDRFLRQQIERFEAVWRDLERASLTPPYVHFSNSAATIRGAFPSGGEGTTIVARAGYALYGLPPSAEVPVSDEFRPVLTLKSRLARVFTLPEGEAISYGRSFVAARPIRCATLPIGYGDGLPRHLSNRGWASVRGARCPIRGRVAMDQTVIEVEGAPDAAEGDEATIYGDGRDESMTVTQAGDLCGTIGYEIVTTLSARLPRIFLQGDRPVAVSDLLGLEEVSASQG
jgi:alanine racemase